VILKRFSEGHIESWFKRKHRKPLVIRGARQVGKSTLVRNFAQNNNLTLHEINLERHPQLVDIFDKLDTAGILRELEHIGGKGKISTSGNNHLLFLDEIQAVPSAIKALRYFYEDFPGLPLIAAGSLLEFTLSDHSYSMPVGRIEYFYMGPMTFEEFLLAKNESFLLSAIRDYEFQQPFPLSAHQKLSKYQAEYLLVGGMPEAIQVYIETDDFEEVMNIHSSIIETYLDDFAKYARDADLLRLHRIFDYVPTSVGEKTKYSNIDPNEKARELRKAIGLLEKANVIFCVYHSKAPGVPLKVGKNDKVFKMFFLDVGLMNRICKVQHIPFEQLEKKEFVNQGKMAEQFIQQHLLRIERANEKPEIFYWLREGRAANAEIDFIIQLGGSMVPVEVKAGATGSLKSLHRFVYEKKLKFAIRFDMTPPSLMDVNYKLTADAKNSVVTFKLMSLPLYMVEQLPRLFRLFAGAL